MFKQEKSDALTGPPDVQTSTPLPVLCVEDGMVFMSPLRKERKETIDIPFSKVKLLSWASVMIVDMHLISLNSHYLSASYIIVKNEYLGKLTFAQSNNNILHLLKVLAFWFSFFCSEKRENRLYLLCLRLLSCEKIYW